MAKYTLTTLTVFFYPTADALQRALAREESAGVYSDAQVFDLAKPVQTGVVTRFRNTIAALHAAHGMDVQSRNGTMPGFMVLFYKRGTTMRLLADQGVVWDDLPENERAETMSVVKKQREAHMEALDEPNAELHLFHRAVV
jgi:hypothetical protein